MSRNQAAALLGRGVAGIPAASTTELLELTGRWPLLLALVNGLIGWRVRRGEPAGLGRRWRGGPAIPRRTRQPGRHRPRRARARCRPNGAGEPRAAPRRGSTPVRRAGYISEGVPVPDPVTELLWLRTGSDDPATTRMLRETMIDLSLLQVADDGILLHEVLRSYLRHRAGPAELARVNREFVEAARICVGPDARVRPVPLVAAAGRGAVPVAIPVPSPRRRGVRGGAGGDRDRPQFRRRQDPGPRGRGRRVGPGARPRRAQRRPAKAAIDQRAPVRPGRTHDVVPRPADRPVVRTCRPRRRARRLFGRTP